MIYAEMKIQPYIDLRIGVMFYFYENPSDNKNEIKDIFKMYYNITNLAEMPFLAYRYDTDRELRIIKSNYISFFNGFIDRNNFNLSKYICMTDATSESLQNVKCEMMLFDYSDEFLLRLPNRMYFEFLPSVRYDNVFDFVHLVCKKLKIHYCCSNPLFGINDYFLTQSSSYSVKQVQNLICLSDKYSFFDNLMFLKDLKTGIDGANAIQVLSDTLYNMIGQEKLIFQCNECGLYCESENDYIIISVSNEKMPEYDEEFLTSYVALNDILKDIIISDIKKPLMFWKQDEWKNWRVRKYEKK